MSFFLVMLLGAFVGVSELLMRYRDDPIASIWRVSSSIYILLNAFAALLALFLMRDVFELFGCVDPSACTVKEVAEHVMLAGLSGMAVLRASVMTLKVQGQEIGVGPAALIQIYMDVADRATDRGRAEHRATTVANMMSNVDFDKVKVSLPATCFALMQNVGADEQKIVSDQVHGLEAVNISPSLKSLILALTLMDFVGERALRAAIRLLDDNISA